MECKKSWRLNGPVSFLTELNKATGFIKQYAINFSQDQRLSVCKPEDLPFAMSHRVRYSARLIEFPT